MSQTKLIYDGFLSEETAGYIRGSEYGYWIEMKDRKTFPWKEVDSVLKDYTVAGEDCMGNDDVRTTKKYMLVENFMGIASREEKEALVARFGEHIKKEEPFQTVF